MNQVLMLISINKQNKEELPAREDKDQPLLEMFKILIHKTLRTTLMIRLETF